MNPGRCWSGLFVMVFSGVVEGIEVESEDDDDIFDVEDQCRLFSKFVVIGSQVRYRN